MLHEPENSSTHSPPASADAAAVPVFRQSRPADLSAIRAIFRQGNLSLPNPEATHPEHPAIGKTFIHLLELHGEVLAVLHWRDLGKESEILDIAVAESHRRRGYASRLLREFLLLAKQRGTTDVFLEVRESNVAALALYHKLGFISSGRRPNYYRHTDEAALLLHRKL